MEIKIPKFLTWKLDILEVKHSFGLTAKEGKCFRAFVVVI